MLKLVGILTIAVSSLLVVVPLAAQTPRDAPEAPLEEILVTASKRGQQSVLETPLSVTAISGDTVDAYSLRSIEDIARIHPSLNIATQGVGDSTLIIRGVSSLGSGTVGLYLDEAVITGANFQDGGGRTPDVGTYDIERVEVLKGPQGTLFGASSMTGTVRIISNKPDAEAFDAFLSATGNHTEHGDSGYNINGMVNVPLIADSLAVRAVGWYDEKGGFIDHYAGFDGVTKLEGANDSRTAGGRVSARWTLGERANFTVFGMTQETDVDGPQFFTPIIGGVLEPITIIGGAPFLIGQTVPAMDGVVGDLVITRPAQFVWDDEFDVFGGTAEFDFEAGQLLATANYFDRTTYSRADSTAISTRFGVVDIPLFFATGTLTPIGAGQTPQTQDRSVLSSELRFSSDLDGPFNFVTGLYYQEDETFTELTVVFGDRTFGLPACGSHAECVANPAAAARSLQFTTTQDIDLDAYAVFGHADFALTEKLTLGAGARYYESDQHNVEFIVQGFQAQGIIPPVAGGPIQTVPIPGVNDTASFHKTTFDAGISYKPDEEQLYYFRAASGFRQGGINDTLLAASLGIIAPATFEPDEVLSLEVGMKRSWLDSRLSLIAAYYKMFWDDIWVPGQEPTGSFEFIANAAEAEIDGIEVEVQGRPSERWFAALGINWLNGELSEDQTFPPGLLERYDAVGQPRPPAGLEGDPIPRSPDLRASATLEYNVPVDLFGSSRAVFRALLSYTDEAVTFFNSDFPGYAVTGDYFLADLNAALEFENWELVLLLQNAADERARVDIVNSVHGFDVFTVRPRTVGLQLNWRLN